MATCWPKQSSSARIKRVTGNRERGAVGRLETVEMYHLGCWFGFCVGAHITIALSSARRCPTMETPKSFKSPAVRLGRSFSVIAFSRKAASPNELCRLDPKHPEIDTISEHGAWLGARAGQSVPHRRS
jgi:hypothetical protein